MLSFRVTDPQAIHHAVHFLDIQEGFAKAPYQNPLDHPSENLPYPQLTLGLGHICATRLEHLLCLKYLAASCTADPRSKPPLLTRAEAFYLAHHDLLAYAYEFQAIARAQALPTAFPLPITTVLLSTIYQCGAPTFARNTKWLRLYQAANPEPAADAYALTPIHNYAPTRSQLQAEIIRTCTIPSPQLGDLATCQTDHSTLPPPFGSSLPSSPSL